jgi:hypothetical protein
MRALTALLALAAVSYRFPQALAEDDDGFPTAKDRALMQWFKDGGGELHQARLLRFTGPAGKRILTPCFSSSCDTGGVLAGRRGRRWRRRCR